MGLDVRPDAVLRGQDALALAVMPRLLDSALGVAPGAREDVTLNARSLHFAQRMAAREEMVYGGVPAFNGGCVFRGELSFAATPMALGVLSEHSLSDGAELGAHSEIAGCD